MNTQEQLITKFSNPMVAENRKAFEKKWMVMYDLPADVLAANPVLPSRIYMNKLVVQPFENVLKELLRLGLLKEIKTYDGCFNVRFQRGSTVKLSRHSFGLAYDFNAAWNPLVKVKTPPGRDILRKQYVKWSEPFLQVWRDNGFSCGADWTYSLDGMHFEYVIL